MEMTMRKNYHNLGCAVVLEAVKEYFEEGTSYQKKAVILKELRTSAWLDLISDGIASIVAEEIVKHPEEIKARLKGDDDDGETVSNV